MLKALLGLSALALTLPSFPGCPRATTVELVNHTAFPIDVQLFYSDDQNTLKDVLQATGHEVDFTIPAGNTESFSKNCNDIQAVLVHVDVNVAGSIGPSKTSDVFRDGDDFNCGDTVSFTFTTPAFPSEVNIDFSQRP